MPRGGLGKGAVNEVKKICGIARRKLRSTDKRQARAGQTPAEKDTARAWHESLPFTDKIRHSGTSRRGAEGAFWARKRAYTARNGKSI